MTRRGSGPFGSSISCMESNSALGRNGQSLGDIIFKVFDVDSHTLMARNEYRGKVDGKYIPDTVMESMIRNFIELKNTFEFKDIIH